MSNIIERSKKIISITGFSTCVIIPIEIIRTISIVTLIVPLIIFSTSEYIIIGKQVQTEQIVNIIEFGGKELVANLAKENGIDY